MIDVISDLEKLTQVPQKILKRLISCLSYAMIDNVIEENYRGKNLFEFDIGIGSVSIEVKDDSLYYSFKPSSSLETALINAINDNTNTLELKLSDSIDKHIYKTYKEMF